MPTVRTKRELSAVKRDAKDVIKMNKADIKEALSEYRKVSRIVKRTGQAYLKRQKKSEKSGSDRAALRSDRAEEAYRFTRREYDSIGKRLKDCLSAIESEYTRVIDAHRARGNIKAMERAYSELDSYRDGVLSAIEKIDTATPNLLDEDDIDLDGLDYLDEPEYPDEPEVREEPRVTERREPPRAPAHITSTVTSVTVEPVSIDVTPIVERAIESFVSRLDAGLSARLDEYVRAIELPDVSAHIATSVVQPAAAAVPAVSGEVTALSTELLSEEEHIVEKLRTMCTSIASLLEEMTALSASYHDISLKCRELAELQRTVNDMQRHTAREQKGVGVNQKLIADEQAEIIAAGTLVAESQKELAERQSALAALESEAVAISERNTAEMESIIAAERALADRQAELVNLARKISDSIEQSIERESELYSEQKEAISRTKKLIREQKQLSEKVASAKPEKKSRSKKEDAGEESEASPVAESAEDNKPTEE